MARIPDSVRNQLRLRAAQRCEYCRKPEAYGTHDFHADHIISKRHQGSDEPDNLAWACFECNNKKGPDVGAYDLETQTLVPLFNPRTQKWDDHFELKNAVIAGKTPIGRATVAFLDFNHPDELAIRQVLIDADLF